jgi:hypothetical protein
MSDTPKQPARKTWQVNVGLDGPRVREWCARTGIQVRITQNFDGGGFNHHVAEFTSEADARAVIEQFSGSGYEQSPGGFLMERP